MTRLRGALRLLRQRAAPVRPGLRAHGDLEALPGTGGGWRALSADACFRLQFAGAPPVGVLNLEGRVDRHDGQVTTQALVCVGESAATEYSRFEWLVPEGPAFCVQLYVPLWCRSLLWQPVDAPGTFHAEIVRMQYRGLAQSLGRLLTDRWRLRWHRLAPALQHTSNKGTAVVRRAMQRLGITPPQRSYAWLLRRIEPGLSGMLRPVHAHQARMQARPTFALVLWAENDNGAAIRSTLQSVVAQTWPDWTLLLVSGSPDPGGRGAWLARDGRIRWHPVSRDASGSTPLADAIGATAAACVITLRAGDILAPTALYAVAATLEVQPDCQLVYSDEDCLAADGLRRDPVFKSGWNPELLESFNYIGGLAAFARDRFLACGGVCDATDSAAAYAVLLRFTRGLDGRQIRHVPAVLLHRTATERPAEASWERTLDALRLHLADDTGTVVERGLLPGTHRVRRAPPSPLPRATIIVPSRDGGAHLKNCVASLFERTDYANYELLLVDNQSTDPETLEFLAQAATRHDVRVIPYAAPFNYSAINNLAARQANGTVLVLLNDDTEVLSRDWLRELVSQACRPDVGAVGAKLYYPDGTVQHGGVGLGIGGVAGHLHLGAGHDADGYLGRLKVTQAIGAVTGACLAVERAKFEAVGGLDETHLHVALNDIDLCLKLADKGWRCVWTPYAELVHHESKSRGKDTTPEKRELFRREHALMRRRWPRQLADDPYYHRHLSRSELDLRFNADPRPFTPWKSPRVIPVHQGVPAP
ncbi:MAG: glycosyltransferase family 2 protein [Panacagrimonas sp.]